jgi:hypothetical protein
VRPLLNAIAENEHIVGSRPAKPGSARQRPPISRTFQTAASAATRQSSSATEEVGIQPWPHPHGLAGAEVRVTEDQIQFWYGDESNPTVAFEPIAVADCR